VYGDMLGLVRATPGIAAASIASNIPFGESQEGRQVERVAADEGEPVNARGYRVIGADYFKMLGLRMLRGREFTAAEEASADAPGVAIVDEAFARRLFGDGNPLGQMIRMARDRSNPGSVAGAPLEIVGVAPPLRTELLDHPPVPHLFVPFGRYYRSGMFVQVRLAQGVDEREAGDALRRIVREVDPRLPVLTLSSMQAFHDHSIELWLLSVGASMFAGLGALALLLAAIGVYGVRAYLVAQRTREFGIRMALGADPRDVLRLVLKDGLRLAAGGIALGVPLAALVSIGLRSVFVEIGGFDVVVLITATVVLAAAVTIAGAVPARRATRVDPVRALSTD
jgi:hypothetical protein